MKVPLSIRRLFENQHGPNTRLKAEVDRRFQAIKDPRWHYESRVKELDSFALKVESGRFTDPSRLEDFFACTLVVANALEIAAAEKLVGEIFSVHGRRPENPAHTHKRSDTFTFDNLRLYASLGVDPTLPPLDLAEIPFEVQIRTFLQHAWSIATHDLVYKTDDVNWSKERIAFQIKAMLEHAELSIQEAERLAESEALRMEDDQTALIRKGIALLKVQWPDELPKDIRRLAQNITGLLTALRLEVNRLAEILAKEKNHLGGSLPLNLSPYATVVQSLLRQEHAKMMKLLTDGRQRVRVLIPSEVELPKEFDRTQCRNAIFVGELVP